MTDISSGLVSTIIPVHNRPEQIVEAVASVLAQSYRPIEIVIVDDGSTDSTPDVCRALMAANPDDIRFARIENGGPGVARETGRKMARGEFIQYLDSDDRLLPEKFSLQVSGLRGHPECDVAYGITSHHRPHLGVVLDPWKRTGERIDSMFPAFLQSRWWGTSTPLYRRSVVDRAGEWTALRNEEDWEYDCRIAALGTRLYYCAEKVSEQYDDGSPNLSRGGGYHPEKLSDRATAHRLILGHAQAAGISADTPEMQHFAKELFLLSRQCGRSGLARQSRDLFELSRLASLPAIRRSGRFRIYSIGARIFGWTLMGKWSCSLDHVRNLLRGQRPDTGMIVE